MAVIGSHLDPDHGFLFQGPKGLVYDLTESFKPLMIDNVIISLTAEGITKDDYECGSSRCILRTTYAAAHAALPQFYRAGNNR